MKSKTEKIFEYINDIFYVSTPLLMWWLWRQLIFLKLPIKEMSLIMKIVWVINILAIWAICYGTLWYRGWKTFFAEKKVKK